MGERVTRRYPVTLTPDDHGTFLATCPDVPGVVTFGRTRADALQRALEALLTVFDALMEDGEPIPLASPAGAHYVDLPNADLDRITAYMKARAA